MYAAFDGQVFRCSSDGWGYSAGVASADIDTTLTVEERWLHAAASGDRAALGALYDRFAPGMLAVAQRVLGSPREAEDLVHDVFLEAWHRARHYDRTRGSVQTWLMLRLRSRALDRVRATQRRQRLAKDSSALDEAIGGHDITQEQSSDRARETQQLHGMLAELKLEQRQVLELAYFEGMQLSEIAARLTVPLGTVKSRMSRAIAELRARAERKDERHD